MEGRQKRYFGKLIVFAAVVLLLIAVGAVVCRIRKENGHISYSGDRYIIQLNGDGTFFFYDVADSRLQLVDSDNYYQWEDDLLVLEFETSEDALYFCRDKDTLVFQGDLSVWTSGPRIADGAVFTRIGE